MTSGWSNPGPARHVVIEGTSGELLVYSPVPATGNLQLSISAVAGTDPYGNHFPAGLGFNGMAAGSPPVASSISWDTQDPAELGAIIDGRTIAGIRTFTITGPGVHLQGINMDDSGAIELSGGGGEGTLSIDGWDNFLIQLGVGSLIPYENMKVVFNGVPSAGHGLQIGSGYIGGYHAEAVTPSGAQSFANGVAAQFTNLGNSAAGTYLNSDYGSGWNLATGVWTCPVTALYDVMVNNTWSAWVAGSPTEALFVTVTSATYGNNNILLHSEDGSDRTGDITVSGLVKLFAGETYAFQAIQTTGAARTPGRASTHPMLTIARRI